MATTCQKCNSALQDDSRFCGKCGAPACLSEERMAIPTKTIVTPISAIPSDSLLAGKYRIIEEIGRGGMGIVYRAEDLKLGRSVALKFMPPDWARDKTARERFILEARAAASLSHPNICTIYEVDDSGDSPFIAMEFIAGETLREKIRAGSISLQDALTWAVQMADGLETAHGEGIVHRDIKSANIMVTAGGQAKIMDFGLAKLRGEASLTGEGITVGTVAYMSPEQAQGKRVDRRTDIWSLGVVLYEMVSGELPFRGEQDASLLYSIVNEPPRSLRNKKPPVPSELLRVIGRALNKDLDSRYQTAAEMRSEIVQYQDAARAEVIGIFNIHNLLKKLRRPAVVIPLIVGVLAVGSFAFWYFSRRAKISWAKSELLPELVRTVDKDSYMLDKIKIYDLAVKAERYIPDDPQLRMILDGYSTSLSVKTDPPGAAIMIQRYHAPNEPWQYLGLTPVEGLRLPYGFFRLKLAKDGYRTVLAACTSWDWDDYNHKSVPARISRKLDREGEVEPGMIRIEGVENKELGRIEDFFMDRMEVTNRQFKAFVDQGGYRNKVYWKNRFISDKEELTWEEAQARFVDSTGRPGPSTWQAGDYAEGHDDFPVSGVSWYEAAAYAEFIHKTLPTGAHWGLALGEGNRVIRRNFYEFFTPQSNFKGRGPERVGSNPAITPSGLSDMGGNVREWCSNATPQGRLVRGGAWDDSPYMSGDLSQLPAFDRSAKNGFRCAVLVHPERTSAAVFASVEARGFKDLSKQTPAPEAVFKVYKGLFSYDRRDLNVRVESRDESPKDWITEKVSFDAAYEGERVTAYLFLPVSGRPPYQTVIYFPGTGSARSRTSRDLENYGEFREIEFLVKNGRALLYPVYKGTFERGSDALAEICEGKESHQYTDYFIKVVKDLRRSIDYLETRTDIDKRSIAYLGFSWGARYGAIIPAVEDRLKASVLRVGGAWSNALPEVNEINYVGHVKIPTLMLNGKYDMTFPYEPTVKPMFDLLGTLPEHKEYRLYETDHYTPTIEFIRETLSWLDRYLGPVNR